MVKRKEEKVLPSYQSRLEWIPVAGAQVEPRAQRKFNPAHANRIAAEFDPDGLGFPFVWQKTNSRGEKINYIIDGQHRFAAVRIALGEDQKIQCEVVSGESITLEDAARMYRLRQASRQPAPIDLFLIGLTARDPVIVAINEAVKEVGLSVGRDPHKQLRCCQSLIRIYNMDGQQGNVLQRALHIATSAWGTDKIKQLHGDILVGLALVIDRYRTKLNEDHLLNRLAAMVTPLTLLGQARAYSENMAGAVTISVARVIVWKYNAGQRSRALPDWDVKIPRNYKKSEEDN